MQVAMRRNIPFVKGLEKGDVILFFAEIADYYYCVIFGPEESCLPKGEENVAELFDAKVALGKLDAEMDIVGVRHGHKYKEGGGMVETERGEISFRWANDKPSTFNGVGFQAIFQIR